jgi:glycosyltransferase involved in cell wall biosynthesis
VLAKGPSARLLIVGFGSYRTAVEELIAALGRGDLAAVRGLAGRGREPEGLGDGRPLRHLLAFLDGLAGERRERYLAAARELPERVLLTGRLEHGELAEVRPACAAVVVPSTFPEAFGMVAAEAAACGALPISAAHSGLAEVSRELAGELPELASYLSFPVDDAAVESLAGRITGWLTAPAAEHARARPGLAGAVRERWSWQSVGRGVIAAAEGRLEELPAP